MGTNGRGALKTVMAGAHAVQVVAALLIDGPGRLARIRRDLSHWLEEAFERGNYRPIPNFSTFLDCMLYTSPGDSTK
jgi:hypothetical protein